MRVQHQQLMQVVEFVDNNVRLMEMMNSGIGAVDKSLKKLGIKDAIEAMQQQDDDPVSSRAIARGDTDQDS